MARFRGEASIPSARSTLWMSDLFLSAVGLSALGTLTMTMLAPARDNARHTRLHNRRPTRSGRAEMARLRPRLILHRRRTRTRATNPASRRKRRIMIRKWTRPIDDLVADHSQHGSRICDFGLGVVQIVPIRYDHVGELSRLDAAYFAFFIGEPRDVLGPHGATQSHGPDNCVADRSAVPRASCP